MFAEHNLGWSPTVSACGLVADMEGGQTSIEARKKWKEDEAKCEKPWKVTMEGQRQLK
jgi:hypothetical protein